MISLVRRPARVLRRHARKALALLAFIAGIAGGTGLYVGLDGYYLRVTASIPVSRIAPTSGSVAGGTSVTITGKGFTRTAIVHFGPVPAARVTVVSSTEIIAVSPPGTGTVDLIVTVGSLSSARTARDLFSYRPVTIFSDRFCTTMGGWTVSKGQTGGHYGSCAFRIYANANDIESSEPRAEIVYPVAPSGIKITVTARRLLGAAEGDEFGVACRADGQGYAFIVQSDQAEIIKYSSTTGQIGQPLARVSAAVDMNAHNMIQASCATASDGAAQLALSVNGKTLASATDKNNPIPSGTVGIFAATASVTATPTEVEFEDFTVTQL